MKRLHDLATVCTTVDVLLSDEAIIGIERVEGGHVRAVRRGDTSAVYVGYVNDALTDAITRVMLTHVAPSSVEDAWEFFTEGLGLTRHFVFVRKGAQSDQFETIKTTWGRDVIGFKR